MPKYTLLEIVQECLNDIDGDEVNSINDTIESTQVALIVRSSFNAMMSSRDWPHTKQLINLNTSNSISLPTHINLQTNISRLLFINYNKSAVNETRLKYEPVTYKEPEEFLRMLNGRNSDDAKVDIITDPTGVVLNIYNTIHPSYFTSFNETNLVMDSYDKTVDTTLVSSKIQAMAYVIPGFELTDDFVPNLPEEAFPALIEEAKAKVSAKLRQTSDPKAEQEIRRQQKWLSRNDWVVNGGVKYPDYGRKRRK